MPAPAGGPTPAATSGSELPLPVEGAQKVRTVAAPRGTLTSTRSKARRAALDLLFEAEQRGRNVGDLLAERLEAPVTQAPLRDYTVAIVRGVVANWAQLDELLSTYSQAWPLERMPAVDRAILRIGAWEILHNDEVPDGVAVSEAVAIATAMSTDDSPAFVNGLLSRVAEVKPSVLATMAAARAAEEARAAAADGAAADVAVDAGATIDADTDAPEESGADEG